MQPQGKDGPAPGKGFDSAAMGALAHLYRGELYRSKIWRTRLDATTNWAVATTGIAISVSFSGADVSGLPLVLIGLLVAGFLLIEGRRYRYFDIWRSRVRLLETRLYCPILRCEPIDFSDGWNETLASDYGRLRFHITMTEAVGRRLRRNYLWIFLVLGLSYLGKLLIHPDPFPSFGQVLERAQVGPIPGGWVLGALLAGEATLVVLAVLTLRGQKAAGRIELVPTSDPGRTSARDE